MSGAELIATADLAGSKIEIEESISSEAGVHKNKAPARPNNAKQIMNTPEYEH